MLRLALILVLVALPAAAQDRGEMEKKDTLRDAVVAPLEDLNIKQARIPPVLVRARDNPYDVEGLDRCEAIAAEIGRLDAALGPDLDEAPPPDSRTKMQKAGGAVKDLAVSETRGATTDLIPFRSWVRKLTGAARHDKKVQAAIKAGGVRRGYLKGVGMRMNCAPPAAPSWFVPEKPKPAAAATDWLTDLWRRITAWFWNWWPFQLS